MGKQQQHYDFRAKWEQNMVSGNGPGPRISLGIVKKDKDAMFKLQEKYKGMSELSPLSLLRNELKFLTLLRNFSLSDKSKFHTPV